MQRASSHAISDRKIKHKPRVAPVFQSTSVVLPALHYLAVSGNTSRHTGFLVSAMGHLTVANRSYVDACYRQALGIAFGSRSIAGLESIVLTGLNNALVARDFDGAKAGLTALRYLSSNGRSKNRPILFLDSPSNMMTVFSTAEFAVARTRLLNQPQRQLFAMGAGPSMRGFGSPVSPQIEDAKIDQSTCRAWVEWVGGVGVTVVIAANVEVVGGLSVVERIVGGLRVLGLKDSVVFGKIGFEGAKYVSTPICTGLNSAAGAIGRAANWVGNKLGGSSSGESDSTTHVTPADLGVTPRDMGVEPEDPQVTSEPPAKQEEPPTGKVEEGDGFDAVQVNGPTSATITSQDGSSSTVTVDSNGNTTVTNVDSNGNVTSVQTYDAQGNELSSAGDGSPPSPQEGAGYPAPDSDGVGGPAGFASLVAYPNPDDAGTDTGHGRTGPAALVGLGATYQLQGAPALRFAGGSGSF